MVRIFRGTPTEQIAAGSHVLAIFSGAVWAENLGGLRLRDSFGLRCPGPLKLLDIELTTSLKILIELPGEDGSLPYDCRNYTTLPVERDGEVPP